MIGGQVPFLRKDEMRETRQNATTTDQADVLLNELRAIDHWDAQYEQHHGRKWADTIAYISRQKRRGEIIRQLLLFSQNQRGKK